jgi:hypothetical protein
LDFIPRVSQEILIGLVEAGQISILEISESAQNLRRFAIEQHQRVRHVLQYCGPAGKSERRAHLILVQRFGSEKVEIEGFSMPEMERDGGPAVQDETQLLRGH